MTSPLTRPRVVHLFDDSTAGGVMRVLDHIVTSPQMAADAQHILRPVDRNSLSLGRIEADIIVSHLAVRWRALPMLALLRARHPRVPLLHVEHSYTQAFVAENVQNPGRFACLLRLAYGLFDRVIAVSHAQGQWLCNSGAVPLFKLTVIQSCVDLSAFRAIAPPVGAASVIGGSVIGASVIGAIGRLDRQKGFDCLITAFRQSDAPDLELHIYGEGSEEPYLRSLAEGDPRIQFKGFAIDPVKALAAVDLVAMPSRWEAYGLVALETLAAGRLLLVSGLDGLADHVANGAISTSGSSVSAWRNALDALPSTPLPAAQNAPDCSKSPEQIFASRWCALISVVLLKPCSDWTYRLASEG
jgi:glycosyltransferase involved in cell wall biosynthesis